MRTEVKLRKLHLVNFKGAKDVVVNFEDNTTIFGANRSGKTTLFDSFTWLLFGKDSTDRKDFEIKTLDSNNNVIEKIDHSVEGILWVNDEEITLKRVLREKWVKQRGSLEATFQGNETLYYWNEVPMNQKEYTSKIAEIIDEYIFKLLSNPLAFNSLKWQDMRTVLTNIAGNQNLKELVKGDNELLDLLQLTEKKTIQEIKKENLSKVKKIKEDLSLIPTRIDEVEKSKPEALDFVKLEEEKTKLESDLKEIESQLLDLSKANESELTKRTELQNEKYKKESELNKILNQFKIESEQETRIDTTEADNLKLELRQKESKVEINNNGLKDLQDYLKTQKDKISSLENEADKLRNDWIELNSKQFVIDPNETICKCCNRPLDNIEDKKEEFESVFNSNKKTRLESISAEGKEIKLSIEKINGLIEKTNTRIEEVCKENAGILNQCSSIEDKIKQLENSNVVTKSSVEVYNEKLFNSNEVKLLSDSIELLNKKLSEPVKVNNESLLNTKKELENSIELVKKDLSLKDQIIKAESRILELKEEEKSLSNSLNILEKQQFTIERLIKIEITSLEESINSKFDYVSFKMFETQINGGEVETCKTLIDGVPFSDANTASKINAGLDIINILSHYYNVSAPIFIDNRESVTDLIKTNSQVINLVVSPSDKKLRVENN